MSRRKQAKPRAFKADDEDHTRSLSGNAESASGSPKDIEPHCSEKLPKTSLNTVTKEGDIAMDTTKKIEEGIYHCQVCDKSFASLTLFMEHRNSDCHTVFQEDSGSTTSSPVSVETSHSPARAMALTNSADDSDIPFMIGSTVAFPYKCDFCEKAFSRMGHLKKHEQIHTDQLPYQCDYCHRLFKHKRSRDRHIRLHTGDKKYKCPEKDCSNAFARSDHLKLHMKTHENKISTKSQQDGTKDKEVMKRQVASSKQSPMMMKCLLCSKSFSSLEEARSHFENHCNQDIEMSADEIPGISILKNTVEKVTTDNSNGFSKNFLSIMNYQCSFCTEVLQGPVWLAKHLADKHSDADKIIPCSVCQVRKFKTMENILDHLLMHEEDAKHAATAVIAGKRESVDNGSFNPSAKRYKQEKVLSSKCEQNLTSTTKLEYTCPHCAKQSLKHVFDTIEALELHINTMHGGKSVQMYSCPQCEAMFPTIPILNDHIDRLHDQGQGHEHDPIFGCKYCNMKFNTHRLLSRHVSAAHREHISNFLAEATQSCDGTNMEQTEQSKFSGALTLKIPQLSSFSKSLQANVSSNTKNDKTEKGSPSSSSPTSSLSPQNSPTASSKQHLLPNAPLPWLPKTCERCNATFKEPWSFEAHMKIHQQTDNNDAIKHKCVICGAPFGTEAEYETHSLMHFFDIATEYGCTSCRKVFEKPDELQKHLMDMHAHHLYQCSLCEEIFDSKVNVQVHFAVKHSNECKLHKCASCALLFRSEMEWCLHVKVDHLKISKPFRCLMCKESFRNEKLLQKHVDTAHSKQFQCPMCSEAFHIEFLLDKHMQALHSGENNNTMVSINHDGAMDLSSKKEDENDTTVQKSPSTCLDSPSKSNGASSPKPLKTVSCEICDKIFTDEVSVQLHRAEVHQPRTMPNSMNPSVAAAQASSSSPQFQGNQLFHPCIYCKQSFRTKAELEKHIRIHIELKSLKCNICDEAFPSSTILAEHRLQHCKIPQGNICVVCKTALKNEEQFHIHSKLHEIFGACDPCIVCCQTLSSGRELEIHGKYHFQTSASYFTCCVCLQSFETKENLIFKLNASGRAYYVCKPCYSGEDMVSDPFTCVYCEKSFRSKQQFEVHLATVQHSLKVNASAHNLQQVQVKKVNDYCEVVQQNQKFQQSLPVTNVDYKAKYTCCACNKFYEDKENLVTQMNSQNREYYVCKQCYSGENLSVGQSETEPKSAVRKPRCKSCNVKFESNEDLESHTCQKCFYLCCVCKSSLNSKDQVNVKLNAVGQEYYVCKLCCDVDSQGMGLHKCSECNLVFPTPEELLAHLSVHDQQMFQCIKCQQSFATQQEIAAHVTTHMLMEGNVHECNLCNKTFESPAKLQLHLIEHSYEGSDIICCVCNSMFSTTAEIQSHVLSHSINTRPYACTDCNQSFFFDAELQNHAVIHESKREMAEKIIDEEEKTELKENDDKNVGSNNEEQQNGHDGTSYLVCSQCLELFTSQTDLKQHIEHVHGK